MSESRVEVRSIVERKHPSLPRFVAVPAADVACRELEATTVVEVQVNGVGVGRRSLKPWGPGRDVWFLDLTEPQCAKLGLETGDSVTLGLSRAPTEMPDELARLIASHPSASDAWRTLSQSRQRQLAEHVRAAKRAETRVRRSRTGLLGRPAK